MLTTIGKPYRSRIFAWCFGGLDFTHSWQSQSSSNSARVQKSTNHEGRSHPDFHCYLQLLFGRQFAWKGHGNHEDACRTGAAGWPVSGREHRVTRRYRRCTTAITTTQPQQPHTHTQSYTFNHIYIFMCFPNSNPARIAPLRLWGWRRRPGRPKPTWPRRGSCWKSPATPRCSWPKIWKSPSRRGPSWRFWELRLWRCRKWLSDWDFSIGILLSKIFFGIKKSKIKG